MKTRYGAATGRSREAGFSLIEAIVSLGMLATSLLTLAAFFGQGMRTVGRSSGDLVLVQKATEAIESVFTARDSHLLTWKQIHNIAGDGVSFGGIFKDGPQQMKEPGLDGFVNTADDAAIETARMPGRDNKDNTLDDEFITLTDYTREIEIRDLSPSLRQIRVIVRYRPGGTSQAVALEFILVTYMSNYA